MITKTFINNKELNKTITSIFEFAFRTQNKVLEQIPPTPLQYSERYLRKKAANAWNFYPLVHQLFTKNAEFNFVDDKVKENYNLKITEFGNWYKENMVIRLKNEDPLSHGFHQEIANKLLEALSKTNSLPEEFQEIGLKIKKEFISKIFNHFLEAFTEKTKHLEKSAQKESLKSSMSNILSYALSKFSAYGHDLQFISTELEWRMKLAYFPFNFNAVPSKQE